jgi:AraC family transcriptional regulator
MIESADLHRHMPSTVDLCSAQLGWHSLLLRQYTHEREAEPFDLPAVPDQTVALVVGGHTCMERWFRERWRKSNHAVGNLVMSSPGETERMRWHGQEEHQTLHLHLPASTMSAAMDDLREQGLTLQTFPSCRSSPDPLVATMMQALARAVREGAPEIYADSAAHFLANHLLVSHANASKEQSGTRASEAARLGRIDEYLRSHLADDVTLSDLAGVAKCSTFRLIRICNRHWGETPLRRLTRLRMERAKGMLLHSDASVIEISHECGYSNPAHFSTAFRRNSGMAPSTYRTEAGGASD